MAKSKIETVIEKLDKLDERLDSLDKTLVKQEANLGEHMRRTDLLEEKLEPVETHVKMMNGGMKILIILGILAGIIKTVFL